MDNRLLSITAVPTASDADSVARLALSGEIDLSTSHLLVDAIDAAIASGHRWVHLDFAAVTFINSTGLGTMVAATKRLRQADGDLVLHAFQGIPVSALATTGLDHYFTIES